MHLTAAGLFPDEQTLEAVAGQLLTEDIAALLGRVESEARLEGRFFMCRQDGVMEIAALLQAVQGLSLKVRACRPGTPPRRLAPAAQLRHQHLSRAHQSLLCPAEAPQSRFVLVTSPALVGGLQPTSSRSDAGAA